MGPGNQSNPIQGGSMNNVNGVGNQGLGGGQFSIPNSQTNPMANDPFANLTT
jgi:hypothetical protein